jgi:hypothetical protein
MKENYDDIWKAIKRIFFLLAKMVVDTKYFRHRFWLMDYILYELKYEQSLIALRLGYTMQRGLLICVLK